MSTRSTGTPTSHKRWCNAWDHQKDGDCVKYEDRISLFSEFSELFGFATSHRSWESDWLSELEPLWPAVCKVAALLIEDEPVTHATVQAVITEAQAEVTEDAASTVSGAATAP